jgi:hypothetical protein
MDVELGKAVGCKTILIGDTLLGEARPDFMASDLLEAVRTILRWEKA